MTRSLAAAIAVFVVGQVFAQSVTAPAARDLHALVEEWRADRACLERRYDVPMSEARRQRLHELHTDWRGRLRGLDFAALDRPAQIDWILLDNKMKQEIAELELERSKDAEVVDVLPWTSTVVELLEARARVEPVEPSAAAQSLSDLVDAIDAATRSLRANKPVATLALRAAGRTGALRRGLAEWFRFRDGYDPQFSWWLRKPYEAVAAALERAESFLRQECVGQAEDGGQPLVGDPIGRPALLAALAAEFIPYAPEELVALAEREFAWCDKEFDKAASELGFPGDWRKAQEHVKTLHVAPGEQPRLILQLAAEAEAFLRAHDLVTVPALASESWRMTMMSPQRQLVNPFFLGGEVIQVSFPTDGMAHHDKLQSMRGNNIHFSRATVHHELIPGHHLQQFMQARYRPHRQVFETPFWIEGWALYWEMRLYDLGFPQTAEDRVGMLFWRKHRCARIVFSLRFHLGEWDAKRCIEYLVQRVGHEPQNATAEVRRSIVGGYGPLYQAAYMLGGLQIRALHAELVGSKKMTERAFHDAVLHENSMPIEVLRAALTDVELTPEFATSWRFYDAR
ncbi:MAG: DUF885 family protein [Planctomycetota bacterium]